MTDIRVKRIYEPAGPDDGARILVDRVWPRGIAKDEAALDDWLRDAAPSTELRKWFGHDPERWDGFRRRYLAELALARVSELFRQQVAKGPVTLLFSSRDAERNQAVVLAEYLRQQLA